MEREKRKAEMFFPEPPPPLRGSSVCISDLRVRGRRRLGGGRPAALAGARRGTAPGDRRGVAGIGPPWVWRPGWQWAVTMKCNQDQQLLLYHWWPCRAEGLQSRGKAFISAGAQGGPPLASQWQDGARAPAGPCQRARAAAFL